MFSHLSLRQHVHDLMGSTRTNYVQSNEVTKGLGYSWLHHHTHATTSTMLLLLVIVAINRNSAIVAAAAAAPGRPPLSVVPALLTV